MSYQLKIDEILEALTNAGDPRAAEFTAKAEAVANEAAQHLASALGIIAGTGDFQGLDFAGLCVPFRPAFDGQPLPECIAGLDDAEEWAFIAERPLCGQCDGTGRTQSASNLDDEACPVCDGTGEREA